MFLSSHVSWTGPCVLGMIMVYKELGLAAMAGVGILAVLVPLIAIISKLGEILQRLQLIAKDSRIKVHGSCHCPAYYIYECRSKCFHS